MPSYAVKVERVQTFIVETDAKSEDEAKALAIECVQAGDTLLRERRADKIEATEITHLDAYSGRESSSPN